AGSCVVSGAENRLTAPSSAENGAAGRRAACWPASGAENKVTVSGPPDAAWTTPAADSPAAWAVPVSVTAKMVPPGHTWPVERMCSGISSVVHGNPPASTASRIIAAAAAHAGQRAPRSARLRRRIRRTRAPSAPPAAPSPVSGLPPTEAPSPVAEPSPAAHALPAGAPPPARVCRTCAITPATNASRTAPCSVASASASTCRTCCDRRASAASSARHAAHVRTCSSSSRRRPASASGPGGTRPRRPAASAWASGPLPATSSAHSSSEKSPHPRGRCSATAIPPVSFRRFGGTLLHVRPELAQTVENALLHRAYLYARQGGDALLRVAEAVKHDDRLLLLGRQRRLLQRLPQQVALPLVDEQLVGRRPRLARQVGRDRRRGGSFQ